MKFFKKTDIIIIVILIAVCTASWFIYGAYNSGKAVKAEIYYYSKLVKTVDLNTGADKTFTLPQNEHVVFHLYKDGIRFEQSDCPDKICIRTGKIHKIGEMAACLPNGFVMKIVSAKRTDNDADIVVN